MTRQSPGPAHSDSRRADRRIIAPVARDLAIAGWLSVAASALWPVQAAAIAWAVSRWASGEPTLAPAVMAAVIFMACASVRAALEHWSGGLLFDAADKTIAREREILISREARARTGAGSARIAALVVQKLPLLQPWITRYHVAMLRARVLPILLLALAFSQSWVVGLTLLVAGPLIPLFMALVGMAAEQASKRQMNEIATMNDMVMDRLSAMLDIRLLGTVDRSAADFEKRANSLRERTMAVLRVAFLSSTVLELFSALGVAMVAVFVGFTLLGEIGFGSWGGGLSLGQGVFLLLIAPDYFQPLRDLAAAWHDRAAGFAVVAELDELDAAERIGFVGEAEPCVPLAGPISVRCKAAVARVANSEVMVPDLSICEGRSVALVGPSGAGKTTTLAAIAGLVPLASGAIEVNGHSLDGRNADAWRARLALVPQRPHFPDESLQDWLDPRGTGADPTSALERAAALDIVEHLPDGLQTRLGENGGGVSGGQARRLLLARAIMSGASLLLADEPTADLDAETADIIIRSLRSFQDAGGTVIVATHDPRLAAVMDDRIEVTG